MTAASVPNNGIRSDIRVISRIGFAHSTSHFFQLVVPPLFPWLMPEFGLNFTEIGLVMTLLFVISGIGQAAAGFLVDRFGPLRVLLSGIGCFVLAGILLAAAHNYAMLMLVGVLIGMGNCVFHPADFTVLNREVNPARLGYAFSAHGLSGNLGWAIAPVLMTGIATLGSWRMAALTAASIGALAWLVIWLARDSDAAIRATKKESSPGTATSALGFLGVGAVWMCFAFFLLITAAFGGLQNFATPMMQHLYGMGVAAAATTLTAFLLGGAGGMAVGGVLASRSDTHERLIAIVLALAALIAALIATAGIPAWSVSLAMGAMGFFVGMAGPSRDLLVRQAATARFGQQAYGRIYGFVYSGLDAGVALSPLMFGPLMDHGHFSAAMYGIALLQGAAIFTVLRVGRTVVSGQAARA